MALTGASLAGRAEKYRFAGDALNAAFQVYGRSLRVDPTAHSSTDLACEAD